MGRIPVVALLLGAGLFSFAAALPAVSHATESGAGLVAFEGTDGEDPAENQEQSGKEEKEQAAGEEDEELPDEFLAAEEKGAQDEPAAGEETEIKTNDDAGESGAGIIVTALPSGDGTNAGGAQDVLPSVPGDVPAETQNPETDTNAGNANPDTTSLPSGAEDADAESDTGSNAGTDTGNANPGSGDTESDGGILRKITRFLTDERLTRIIEANQTQKEALDSAAGGGETGISNAELWEMTQKLVAANEKIIRRTGQLDRIAQRQGLSLQHRMEQIDSFMREKGAQLTDGQKAHFMEKKAQLEQKLASFGSARQQLSAAGNTLQTGSAALKQSLKGFVDAATARMAAADASGGQGNFGGNNGVGAPPAPWTQALSGNAVPYGFGGAAATAGTYSNAVSSAAKDRRFSESMNSIDRTNKQNSDRLRQPPPPAASNAQTVQ